ncbi:MAG: polyprenyl synthetase family protein [Bacteroidetes bacterium]|nr:polyprenyl synthetase family protein [Bacteroidota bacterium]
MHSLKSLHKRISDAFSNARFNEAPLQLYQPIAYTLDLGGKRLRPLLVLMSCDIFGGEIENAVYPAMGVEIFHNFTLLHDDIMDNAPLRRGNKTVHHKWDTNTAILSGDTMFVIAYEYVAKTNPQLLPQVLDLFNDTARKVCEGQQYDMNFETQADVSIADYMTMIRLKTAVLIACSLKLGAILANAGQDDAEKIYDLGIELGLAFQLQDDFLDAFGDTSKFGKAIGGDIATNKKTFLYIKAFELAKGETLSRLTNYYLDKQIGIPQKTQGILAIYRELKIDEITRNEIEIHHLKAMEILNTLPFKPAMTRELVQLMHEMLGRER